jgi:hypothetical protein
VSTLLADQVDMAQLMREIELYLSAFDVFRRLGCRLRWR